MARASNPARMDGWPLGIYEVLRRGGRAPAASASASARSDSTIIRNSCVKVTDGFQPKSFRAFEASP